MTVSPSLWPLDIDYRDEYLEESLESRPERRVEAIRKALHREMPGLRVRDLASSRSRPVLVASAAHPVASPAGCDPLLLPLLNARTEEERQRALGVVLAMVDDSLIARFAGSWRVSPADREDLLSSIRLGILRRLDLLGRPGSRTIGDVASYLAAIARTVVSDLRREMDPTWTVMNRRIRDVAASDSRFEIVMRAGAAMLGLRRMGIARGNRDAYRGDADLEVPLQSSQQRIRLTDALLRLLAPSRAPVRLSELVTCLLNDRELHGELAPASRNEIHCPTVSVEDRLYLGAVVAEIRELPAGQRSALLLNLRDGGGGNALDGILLLGLATFDELASMMELPSAELETIWARLPLDDLTIAFRLGRTRQQVINLRMSARARLRRRLRARARAGRSRAAVLSTFDLTP